MNKIEYGPKLDFSNVLIRPKRSTINSRSEVDLNRTFKFKYSSYDWTGVPIISANMDTTGTFQLHESLRKHNIITALHKFYNKDDYLQQNNDGNLDPDFFMVSTGIGEGSIEKLVEIYNVVKFKWICIDIANGYINKHVEFCKKVRSTFPEHRIIAGNVVTREMVEELILEGKVDGVKVGIGPGAACTTRIKTGVGMPQLSAIIECSDAAHGVGGLIIGDGGITCPGDMSKAFGGGADFVMVGSAFAGHDENPGDVIEENSQKYKLFHGMSSKKAMETHYGKMAEYRSSEGRELKIKYKGPIVNTVTDYLGGLRSTCTYINAPTIKQMAKCTTFIQVSQQVNTSLL